jgi:tetratricopeptide (TPR) repeat protein
MTGAPYRSAFVAALFALHPLHVESVAWVTERKDVLSTMFWLLTMWAYILYSEKPGILKYLSVVVLFALGLMAKPMLVTIPFVLLLLDYWPLGRVNWGQDVPEHGIVVEKKKVSFLFVEKIPLFVITISSSIITYIAQNTHHAVSSFQKLLLSDRVLNAINSYGIYLKKIFWFQDLSPFYIYSTDFEIWKISGLLLLILTVTGLAIAGIKKFPYLAFGWFWYLGTLIPVIGVIQVGFQAMADRYTYVPLIGIFIMMAWGLPQLLSGLQYRNRMAAFTAVIFLMIITVAAYSQIRIWKNDFTLSMGALKVSHKNYQAYNILGLAMTKRGDYKKAIYYHSLALKYNPEFDPAYNNAGIAFQKIDKLDEAINCYKKALQLNNRSAEAHYNLGIVLVEKNNLDEAIFHFKKALEITPDDFDIHNNLGVALMKAGNVKEALAHFQEALRLNPKGELAQRNMNIAISMQKKI